ncbi:MAG: hypothetical protein VKK32_06925 [Candidatus Melainabacteria bacterium]|nr:hypothetical protein [Candidatus Melainabacteria bacterium]
MIWQPLFLILITVVLGITGLLTQFYQGSKKIYQASFAKREFIPVARAMSNHVAKSSGVFLYTLQQKLKSKLTDPSISLNFREDLKDLAMQHSWTGFNNINQNINSGLSFNSSSLSPLATILAEGTSQASFITKHAKNTDLPLEYDVKLIQSEFMDIYPLETENKYLASIIDESKIDKELAEAPSSYEADFIDANDKLLISEGLLDSLLDVNAVAKVKANPESFGLSLSESGLKASDLATGLRLEVKFPVANLSKDKLKTSSSSAEEKDYYRNLEFISNSQIRLGEKVSAPVFEPPVINPDPQPVNPPVLNPPILGGTGIIDPYDPNRETYFDLAVRSLPTGSHGILFNPEQNISATNPLRIANGSNSAISTIYADNSGHLNISIGKAKDSESLVGLTKTESSFESTKIAVLETFTDGAERPDLSTLLNGKARVLETNLSSDTSNSVLNFSNLNSGGVDLPKTDFENLKNPSLVLDVLPRENKRYGTVDEAFKYQGINIPVGAVVVATKEAGVNDNRPENGEFSYFKVYDSNGALITKFHTDDLGDKSKVSNVNFKYTESQTEDRDGTAIYQKFSTADLFKGQSSDAAVKAFLNIQADLASSQQLNINQQRKDWHEDLYQNLKSDGLNYTGATLETNNAAKAAEILIAEKIYISDKAKELDKKQVQAMLELEEARDLVEEVKRDLEAAKSGGQTQKKINSLKDELQQAEKARDQEKKDLVQARDKYDDYMANRAKEEPVKVAKEKPAESKQNNADAQPKTAPAPQVVAIQSAPKVSASSGSGGGGGGKRK